MEKFKSISIMHIGIILLSVGVYFFKIPNGFSTGGVTTHTVTGEYTHSDKTMIHTVCKRIEAIRLREKIRQLDSSAFVIISTSSEIVGRGFRNV